MEGTPTAITDADLASAVKSARDRQAADDIILRTIREYVPHGKVITCAADLRPALVEALSRVGCPADAVPLLTKLASVAKGYGGQFVVCGLHLDEPIIIEHVPNKGSVVGELIAAAARINIHRDYSLHMAPVLFRDDLEPGKRGGENDALGVCAVVADFDRADDPATRLERLPFIPWCETETSPGNFHCYRFFNRPYAVSEVKPVVGALLRAIGADSTANLDHMFRLPGSVNIPTDQKVAAGKRDPGIVYAKLHLEPDQEVFAPEFTPSQLRTEIHEQYGDTIAFDKSSKAIQPAELDWNERATTQRVVTSDQIKSAIAHCAAVGITKGKTDRSKAVSKFYAWGRRNGMSPEEIFATILGHPDSVIYEKAIKEKSEHWLRKDLTRWWVKQPKVTAPGDTFEIPDDAPLQPDQVERPLHPDRPNADASIDLTIPRHLNYGPLEELRKVSLPDFSRGKPENTIRNAVVCLSTLRVECYWDTFHNTKIVAGHPFGQSVHALSDPIAQFLRRACLEIWGVEFSQPRMYDALFQCCIGTQFNPVTDYLKGLKWDGTKRLETWLIDLFGIADTPFAREVSKLILIAAVRRARKPGTKFDFCLVLEGIEGMNKSTVVRVMAECACANTFCDNPILNLSTKEQMELLAGVWLYEIADLTGMRKAEVEKIKAFMSMQVDRGRPAYGREVTTQPRTCVFIATTNDTAYLQSQTGNRRFWPLRTKKAADIEALHEIKNMLWAEAAQLEAEGHSLQLPEHLWPDAAQEQEARRIADPWEDILINVTGTGLGDPQGRPDWHEQRVHTRHILEGVLRLTPDKQTRTQLINIRHIMGRLGWEHRDNIKISSQQGKGYVRLVNKPLPPHPSTAAELDIDLGATSGE